MTQIRKFFKKPQEVPVDVFFEKILYDKKFGYYSTCNPFGKNGDFVTAPSICSLFGEMIAIWIISYWQSLKKPDIFNLVELGPGNGILTKKLISTFKKFPNFYKCTNFYLYEKSIKLKNIQKKELAGEKVIWLNNFKKINKGRVLFIGNEFFDAIPVKQFKRMKGKLYEKFIKINKDFSIQFILKKASVQNAREIRKYKTFRNSNFFEFPQFGIAELKKIADKINLLDGGVMLIDYGYLRQINRSSLQSVKNHKKNNIFDHLGAADVTSLVNFKFLRDYFEFKKLKTCKIVTQSTFLKKTGILNRAEILSKNMNFREKSKLFLSLQRILDYKFMGEIFKVIFVHNTKIKIPIGFD